MRDLFTQYPNAQSSERVLAVILHGWMSSPQAMKDIADTVLSTFQSGASVDLCIPELPYASWRCVDRAESVVIDVLKIIDARAETVNYEKVLLIGHSLGATLVRRIFLVASRSPRDFPNDSTLVIEPKAWATKVDRIILIAAFNRGWLISERMSWWYSIGFNLIGLIGHIGPKKWMPTIFDIRLGAPFIVQTRLQWLAYRRDQLEAAKSAGENAAPRPILIQLIGTNDDLISPFDQVDIAVDGTAIGSPVDRDYFLIELPDTNHEQATYLSAPKGTGAQQVAASKRRAVFEKCLTDDRPGLHGIAVDPALLADEVDVPDESVSHTVFVIHGIRDDGFWTHRIAERIRTLAAQKTNKPTEFRAWTPTYGYFAMLPFLLPWIRRQKVEWFMDQYVQATAQYPKSDFDFVGHSNGTYLGARALADYPACKFRHVLFAGSVMPTHFHWDKLLKSGKVRKVQNLVASTDWVVALLPKSIDWLPRAGVGGAGFDGFDSETASNISQCRFVEGGHGAGLAECHWPAIAAFIVDGKPFIDPAVAGLPGEPGYALTQPALLQRLSATRVVLPFGVIFAAWILFALFHSLELPWALVATLIYMAILRFILLRL